MEMKLFILITGFLLCLPESSLSLRWLSTPGEILACTGDDVTFHWKYDIQGERVTMIFIINEQTETTFLTYYIDDGYSKTSDEYSGRTQFIEYSQEGAEFMLKSVTKADSVGYIIQLGGIDEKNLANLKVYDKLELKPTLWVINKPREYDQPLNLTSEEIPTVMLSTAQSVPANISISVDGRIAETCTRATDCVYSLPDNNVGAIGFEVDYGVCGMITEELSVMSDEETLSLIPFKIKNSEARMTEESNEMTTFGGDGEITWLSVPGIQYQCVGDDVTLIWNYTVLHDIVEILLTDAEEVSVIMYRVAVGNPVVYNQAFEGRISFRVASQTQAVIYIRKITLDDAGIYYFMLHGPLNEQNELTLVVLNDKELEPVLTVNNERQKFGEHIYMPVGDQSHLILKSSSGLPANISISNDDKLLEFCPMAYSHDVCGCILNTSTPSHQNLTFVFNYGACGPVERMITAVVTGSAAGSDTTQKPTEETTQSTAEASNTIKVIVPVVVLILIILTVMIFSYLYYKWYKPRRNKERPRGPFQSKLFAFLSCIDRKLCCNETRDETPDRNCDKNVYEMDTLLNGCDSHTIPNPHSQTTTPASSSSTDARAPPSSDVQSSDKTRGEHFAQTSGANPKDVAHPSPNLDPFLETSSQSSDG